METAQPSATARVTRCARSSRVRPFASEMKIGRMPKGSTTTRNVVKAVRPNWSVVAVMGR